MGPGVDGHQGLRTSRLHNRPRLQLGLLLSGPLGWLGIAYLGSLAILFVAAFWHLDDFSGKVVHEYSFENFQTLWNTPVYRTIVVRTVGIAALVTITDILLALPLAFYMAKIASRRVRGILVVAVLMPLWASYLVKVYAWRTMLAHDGIINWALAPFGLHGPGYGFVATWIVFSYLWLPYMILPVYAGFERISNSLVDASGDLGGHPGTTFRRVVAPLVMPAVVAGSIFTFSLTLGDYIIPQIIGNSSFFIGQAVYAQQGTAGNIPLAAAFTVVPIVIMGFYLWGAKRMGAFDAL